MAPQASTRRAGAPPRVHAQRPRARTRVLSGALRRGLALALTCGLLAAATSQLFVPAAEAAVPAPSGWSQVWSDDFTGASGSKVNSAIWLYDLGHCYPGCPAGNWGTGEIESMTDSTANVYQDGQGNLVIKPIRDGSGNWTSGRIETQRTDFAAPAGGALRLEGRLQMPNVTGSAAQGYWPAFWALGAPFRGVYTNWPSAGELDVMENVNGANTVWGTLHCGYSPGGPCNETNGLSGNRACPGSSCQAGFHTYAIEFDRSTSPEQLRWYVDGLQFHSVGANQVDATTWRNATDHGFFMILNVAIGGGWPGSPTSATANGVPMVVDYVAAYTRGGSTPTTTTTKPSPSTTTQPSPSTTTQPSPSTTTSRPPSGGVSAYGTIQAEAFNTQSGTQLEGTGDTGGGQDVGWIGHGNWLQYDNVDFGSTAARNVQARVASGAGAGVSGLVEVRLDSRSNPPIGSFALGDTGGWQSWRTIPANLSGVTGTHTVFVTFTSGQSADFVNLNWLTFVH
jgi:beta-glucanase (GH16 family)